MKLNFGIIVLLMVGMPLIFSCSDSEGNLPRQPDFITVSLEEPYICTMGEEFELSVAEEKYAESYNWVLPDSTLRILEGANTSQLKVLALKEGVIKAGTIKVAASNEAGESYARTLWKDINVQGLPVEPAFVKTSIVGSLTVDMGETFDFYVTDDNQIVSYEWTVPENMEIVAGANTSRISVKATQKSVNIPKNAVILKTVDKNGFEQTHSFEKLICVLPLEGYETKRYGNKTWMTVNLNYAGEDGNVGRTLARDPDGLQFGRFYTWAEAMTGLPREIAGEQNPYVFGSTGKDDVENDYTFNYTSMSHNVQIQGVCPEGWHIPNAYDFYDLIASIAEDYDLLVNHIEAVQSNHGGICLPDNREKAPMTSMTLTTYGTVSSYLRGSRPDSEGGLWISNASGVSQGGTVFTYNGIEYPMYFPEKIKEIGFNILPAGQFKGEDETNFGKWSYHWTAVLDANSRAYRFTAAYNNCNFSTASHAVNDEAFNVRCVADY